MLKGLKVRWSRTLIIALAVSVLLVVIDFASKWIVQNTVALGSPVEVIPNFFYINKSYNIAIAFSLGSQLGVWGRVLNITISVVMSFVIYFYWLTHDHKFGNFERIIACLLGAGAVGNLIDRAFYWEATTGFNGVIDFFQFYLGGGPSKDVSMFNPFATFNFADACLTIGIVLLLVFLIVDAIKNRDTSLSKDPRLTQKPSQIGDQNENLQDSSSGEEMQNPDGGSQP